MPKETEQFLQMTGSLLNVARLLPTPEALTLPTQDLSVEVGRKTLRMLRNLQGLQDNMEDWLLRDDLQAQVAKAELWKTLVFVYAGQVKIAQLTNPDLLNHFTIENAGDAAGAVALSVAHHSLDILPETRPEFSPLEESLNALPDAWYFLQAQSVERLLDDMEGGLAHLLNKPMGDRSPLDQLLEISEKIKQTARELYSIDTLEDPAREESIELAREILRRLKNMIFSDKPLEDAIDTGKPNEKLAFARKIGEMVAMYKNLLQQAAISNPEIMHDPRVKQANGAVSECADGISSMALKELPSNANLNNSRNSMSNEKSLMSQEKDVKREKGEKRTTENIMKSMEGGLESASGVVGKKSDADRRADQEQARNRIEAARMVRRRLRREKVAALAATQKPAAPPPPPQSTRTQNTMLTSASTSTSRQSQSSGRVQPVQSSNKSSSSVKKAGLAGLDVEAINAVRQAGSTLRHSSQQARGILNDNAKLAQAAAQSAQTGGGGDKRGVSANSGKAEEVSANDKISPDDKSFAQREQEQKNNPNNPRNPRNRLV